MTDFATDAEVDYHKDETLQIEYLLKDPARSRVPTLITYWQKARVPFMLGAGIGIVVMVLYVITHR